MRAGAWVAGHRDELVKQSLELHHEMAQTPLYPSRLFFFCEQPAAEGGATPICRSDVKVLASLIAME